MGEEAWHDFETWPPRNYAPRHYYLHPGGELSAIAPGESHPDRYRYDPADPTPAVGGIRLLRGGRRDNRKLEARSDVLMFSSAVLQQDVEVIGDVNAEIYFRSSRASADVFVRLCDVDERGRSHNVCDGLVRLADADQLQMARVTMWPTAHRFKRGHRIRVQVSSGAFPRFARNHGTLEPLLTSSTLLAADQEVYHDSLRPSAIIMPVGTGGRVA
jgi:putative CocE/NonD family hydrolase